MEEKFVTAHRFTRVDTKRGKFLNASLVFEAEGGPHWYNDPEAVKGALRLMANDKPTNRQTNVPQIRMDVARGFS